MQSFTLILIAFQNLSHPSDLSRRILPAQRSKTCLGSKINASDYKCYTINASDASTMYNISFDFKTNEDFENLAEETKNGKLNLKVGGSRHRAVNYS